MAKQRTIGSVIGFPLLFVAILWIAHIYKVSFPHGGESLGIYPRDYYGLKGIITAPFSHGDFHHLISNSVPLLVTTTIIFFFYRRVAMISFWLIFLLTGAAVWLFGRSVFHIGASGLVYGLVSFIFWSGVFRRNLKSIILSLVIVVMYSGYFYGILPNQPGISWESHLFGAIVGIYVAYLFKGMIEKDEIKSEPSWAGDNEDENFFLKRDQFDLTKDERRFTNPDD